ncbi:glucose-1-phosphate adenylyltransferase [Rhodospirillum rubrum]|uniref:Glucose-1-phosphate adenylyltransferase n=2 Tax=Rhodospirillum rubrum TaxID=1085 RepID=GLGC_RHORT|nr:glucose-1-phosphate adenylyltransferase [Rhodospirillum rubrum]Q2RS49.1 RecName: Full=Glucose-1-phosphate adenylyltransferase; AltName: Full=ADP-glucose pyrophosphorylase; Short=ADPGlc PPase; AltName: Full=ADP-glucose synthase [Rhodospirillum rubrum ATCC 11170]Q9ZFN4.2 RecName: Full=Glucose-1-phosphate adenylyltransferase; AltName: Full=ADP-glucose pyrophosphorylase; Short=ADPGlc PPase; AltName: Full=ADP-glucose synthase [Rhodospirillum rubrum]AAC71050.2 ADP-glucose pyrophosphorylase [Rhodosp
MDQITEFQLDINRALKETLALVLAGGRGSRLRDLTNRESKPAVPFGGKYRIIDFPLSNCMNSGIRRMCVITQYRAHTLIHHIQRGWGFLRAEIGEFVELWPAQQQTDKESWYLGTADAVHQNLDLIRMHDPRFVLILAGDHIYKQDYSKLLAHHIARGSDCTVACVDVPREEATGYGCVEVDNDDNIVHFLEKPANPPGIPGRPDRAFASMGIYIFNADFLYEILESDALNEASQHDFGRDIIPSQVGKARIVAHRFSQSCVYSVGRREPYWRDVGTVDAYWSANIDLVSVTPALDLYDADWPIWTYQMQRPPAKFVFDTDERRGMAKDSLVSAGCIVSGGAVTGSLLFNDVRVNSYSSVIDTVILPMGDIGRHARLTKCILDTGCRIPEGLVIGEDPILDAKRFHVTEQGITLVTPDRLALL